MRIAIVETLDPDGAMARWASPDLRALGHEVLPLPTQELAPVLGAHGLGRWLVAVGEAFRPDLVMVCPPYDHAPASTWTALRALGAKVVAFAMDEPLFAAARARPAVRSTYDAVVSTFDRLYATAPEAAAALAARGLPARWLRWASSPSSLVRGAIAPALAASLATSAVLVGRPYQRRIDLVHDLAAHVPVHVFGHGWHPAAPPDVPDESGASPAASVDESRRPRASRPPRLGLHGPLTGPEMIAVLAAAGVVVTTGDWETTPIAMVKVRLLEAAFAGAVQVAQRSPDLDAYFPDDEVPRFDTHADLAATCAALLADPTRARAAAERARLRALREHTWRKRFAELAADLDLPPGGDTFAPEPPPAVWSSAICAAACDAERRGALRLAATLFAAAGDHHGESRTLLVLDPRAAATAAAAALAERADDPASTVGLYARVPTPATGLGRVGFLDPTPELEAIVLMSLLASDDTAGALAAIDALRADADRLVATAAILQPDAAHAPVWHALFSAALAASPADRDLQDQHRDRFRDALRRIIAT